MMRKICFSGGKDSCYNMVQCIQHGHSIVALANLRPKDKGIFYEIVLVEAECPKNGPRVP